MDELGEQGEVVDPALAAYERLLARAFASRDPAAVLRAARSDASVPRELADALERSDETGIRLTGLIVARIRFERLLNGSPRAAMWFEDDPRAFAAAFKRYQDEVEPRAAFPMDEARAFEDWLGPGEREPRP